MREAADDPSRRPLRIDVLERVLRHRLHVPHFVHADPERLPRRFDYDDRLCPALARVRTEPDRDGALQASFATAVEPTDPRIIVAIERALASE